MPSKEDAAVRLTAGISITPELAEPVKDKWVLSLLKEDVHDRVVQVRETHLMVGVYLSLVSIDTEISLMINGIIPLDVHQ